MIYHVLYKIYHHNLDWELTQYNPQWHLAQLKEIWFQKKPKLHDKYYSAKTIY
jgi:hypothetical protein